MLIRAQSRITSKQNAVNNRVPAASKRERERESESSPLQMNYSPRLIYK